MKKCIKEGSFLIFKGDIMRHRVIFITLIDILNVFLYHILQKVFKKGCKQIYINFDKRETIQWSLGGTIKTNLKKAVPNTTKPEHSMLFSERIDWWLCLLQIFVIDNKNVCDTFFVVVVVVKTHVKQKLNWVGVELDKTKDCFVKI